MSESATIAATILDQLGGRRFQLMTGAKNFSYGDREGGVDLNFAIGRGAKFKGKPVNRVRVSYVRGRDTYNLTFSYARGSKVTVRCNFDDVYADQLQELFTRATGFDTRMGALHGV